MKFINIFLIFLLLSFKSNALDHNPKPIYVGNFKYQFIKAQNLFKVTIAGSDKIVYQEKVSDVQASKIRYLKFDHEKNYVIGYKNRRNQKRFTGFKYSPVKRIKNSFNDVLKVLKQNPYDSDNLPVIPLQMFKFFGKKAFSFFVGDRSTEILTDSADFRINPEKKPIHPMGIGATGHIDFYPSKYTGVFKGGRFPIITRLSISQGNPYKYKINKEGDTITPLEKQPRSVAIAAKIFPTSDKNEKVVTANAVFQNDLNGEYLYNYLDGVLTNHPQLDFRKINASYEVLTLLGVAKGSLSNPGDTFKKFPKINPQIRPLHQWSESMEKEPHRVKNPTWLKLQVSDKTQIIPADDFREEIKLTLEYNPIIYEIYAADEPLNGTEIKWEAVGEMVLEESFLTQAVDQNLLFFHSSLRSSFTGELVSPNIVPVPNRVE